MKNYILLYKFLRCIPLVIILSCHHRNDQNEITSSKKFKESLVSEIELAKEIVVLQHDWYTDYDVLPNDDWGIQYKKLRLNASEVEELLEIVKNIDDAPYLDARPEIASFHHTIIFERNGKTSHLKISTVTEVCEWNGSTELPPEALCRNLILFLARKGLETSSSEATWKAKLLETKEANR